jgi:hypothetical protein
MKVALNFLIGCFLIGFQEIFFDEEKIKINLKTGGKAQVHFASYC